MDCSKSGLISSRKWRFTCLAQISAHLNTTHSFRCSTSSTGETVTHIGEIFIYGFSFNCFFNCFEQACQTRCLWPVGCMQRISMKCKSLKLTYNYRLLSFLISWQGHTGISGLMRGLATLPPRWIPEPLLVRDRDGKPPRGPPGSAHCFCVCSGSVLLGISLG